MSNQSCSELLKRDGLPYTHPCAWCNLGPCAYCSERPPATDTSQPFLWSRCQPPVPPSKVGPCKEVEIGEIDQASVIRLEYELELARLREENARLREEKARVGQAIEIAMKRGTCSCQSCMPGDAPYDCLCYALNDALANHPGDAPKVDTAG